MPKKPRTKKVITEEMIPVEEQEQVESEFVDPDDVLLQSKIAEFGGGTGVKLKLSRVMPSGQSEYLQTYPNALAQVSQVDEEFIQRTFGGGSYTLRFFRDGQLVHVYTFTVAADPAASALNITNGRPAVDPVTQMLLEDRKIMMQALFDRKSESTPVGELAQAASILTQNKQEPVPWEKLFDVFMKGIEMGRSGDAPSEGGWLGFAKDTLKQVAPAVLPHIAGMLGSGGSAVPAQNPGVPPEAVKMLQMGINYLKKKALAGKDPGFYVDFVLENRDEEIYANLIGLVCSSEFAQIAALDPQIGQEPYHAFFVGLYNGIRTAIAEEQQQQQENFEDGPPPIYDAPQGKANGLQHGQPPSTVAPDRDSAGAGGDAPNPANHGRAGKGRGR